MDLNYLIKSPKDIKATHSTVDVSMEQLTKMRDVADIIRTYPNYEGEVNAGWWHSHPNWGIFFSGTDKENQRQSYPNRWQTGIVVDPIRNEWGAFRGGDSEQFVPFVIPIKDYDLPGSTIFPYKSAVLEDPKPVFKVNNIRR